MMVSGYILVPASCQQGRDSDSGGRAKLKNSYYTPHHPPHEEDDDQSISHPCILLAQPAPLAQKKIS